MRAVNFALATLAIIAFVHSGANAQQERALVDTQAKIREYTKQISSKGEFETSSEFAAKVKRTDEKIAALLPRTFRLSCRILPDTYNADNGVFSITAKSNFGSLSFSVKMDRDEAIQFNRTANTLRGEMLIGVDQYGSTVPVACQFSFRGKNYRYENPAARIAWVLQVESLQGTGAIWASFSSSEANQLYVASKDSIHVVDLSSGRVVQSIRPHLGPLTAIAISTGDGLLATASSNVVKVWDLHRMTQLKTFDAAYPLVDLTFGQMPNGQTSTRILVGAGPNEIWYWPLDPTGALSQNLPHYFRMKREQVEQKIASMRRDSLHARSEMKQPWFAFSKAQFESYFKSVSDTIALYQSGVIAQPDRITSIFFVPDSQQVLSIGYAGLLRFWNPASALETNQIGLGVTNIVVAKDGPCLGYNTEYGYKVQLVDFRRRIMLAGVNGWYGFTLSSDGNLVATIIGNASISLITIYDTKTGAPLYTINLGQNVGLKSLVFSPDGLRLAAIDGSQNVRIWRIVYRKLDF